ncbi:hypothetical protein DES40_1732 [Litorimonas taeanensis]|uniref:Uncharacterized protein n=1 Tax=Litorimonas taeanensis TaxID=568099 RepID=A0A420WD95_9PROT|nr:hypothetical protein [Litorimonas taeanensis]RKQ68956.1 hypothetical protein DES40_1732 [Litorimonas taeanensis]
MSETSGADIPTLMTKAAYARYRGVERQTVNKWKNQGHLVLVHDANQKIRVDVAATDSNLAAMQNPLKAQSEAPQNPEAAQRQEPPEPVRDEMADRVKASRAAKETADARMSNLKYNRAAGNLVPKIEVQGVGPAAAALLHQAMERRRTDLAKRLEHQSAHDILVALKRADFDILEQYAEALRGFDKIAAASQEAGQSETRRSA